MTIETVTKDAPIFQSEAFLQDIVAFNIMLLIMERPNTPLYSDGHSFALAQDINQDIWAWTLSDIGQSQREEMWKFIEYLCIGKHCRVFLKSVLTQPAALDLTVNNRMFAYQCKKLQPVTLANGVSKRATEEDRYILASIIEACDGLNKEDSLEKAARYLSTDVPYLWNDSGDAAVAMAVLKQSAHGYTRIGGVYVRPDCRSMGYERSLIYRISEEILAQGRTPMLYASEKKIVKNKTYTAMGYIRCGQIAEVSI